MSPICRPDGLTRSTTRRREALVVLLAVSLAPACGSKLAAKLDGGAEGGVVTVGTGGAGYGAAGGGYGTAGGSGGDPSGGGAAGDGTGAGGLGEGGAAVACAGFALRQDSVLDLDLEAVSVHGSVTLNGAALPDQTGSRGQIVFDATDGPASLTIDLGAAGAKSYAVRLPPGTYDVSYAGLGGACSTTSTSAMPCGSGSLARGVALLADATLDLDIPVVTVTGQVTLRGAAPPDQPRSRGTLSFRSTVDPGFGATTSSFAPTGALGYRLNVIAGTYDVIYSGDPAGCAQPATLPALPCGSGTIRRNVALTSSGTLDVDIPMVKLAGFVTLSGAAMPAAAANRGSLSFAAPGVAPIATAPFGTSGAPTYAVALLPGTYTISFVANASLCGPPPAPALPCLGGVLMPSVALSADGAMDLDLRAVTISGAVTLNGQPLPLAAGTRGGLTFTATAGGGGTLSTLGTSGAASYAVTLLAGTYDVDYAANQTLCGGAITPALPCTGGPLARGVALTTNGALDLDLKRVLITGHVTVGGAPMPAAAGSRGGLGVARADGAAISSASFGASGEATYALSLWPGVYDVRLVANPALCAAGAPASAVPCVGGLLRSGAPLQADGLLDLDVSAVRVSGNVTLGGRGLPSETLDRGSIAFTGDRGDAASFPLGTTGAATYGLTVTAGTYVVSHAANSALCAPGRAPPGVPCASQIAACTAR